ncbi:hypothetical protein EPD60_09260 [Flaviaesturariibacter flavus]|uniref:Uncharacterized protein n=1 Tax=Flaviaesturariibacter flavus TaxID=2502780 RepID=A0A4R1BB22_9BACT|nr:polysialyltransferase family glycosyltransferase [Flaviaesturariibacter flavus]TCJ14185.1 hypothetical protein EPD60_09260 [Flaviaesturariibacter flavus]
MKILLIVEPLRKDLYAYLKDTPGVEWELLWHEGAEQMSEVDWESLPIRFGAVHYWKKFSTPADLLRRVKPDRIVLFEIIDLRQIALITYANYKGVSTYFLEHGAAGSRETAIVRWGEITFRKQKLPYLVKRFFGRFGDVVKSKWFYYGARPRFSTRAAARKYRMLPVRMLKEAPNKVLAENMFAERIPKRCIVFNEANYEEFALYTGVKKEQCYFTGVPFFDEYYSVSRSDKGHIVYIDQPFYEENLVGWTQPHHERIAKALIAFAARHKVKLYIKLHPRSSRAAWEAYNFDPDHVEIIQHGDFHQLYMDARLLLGYSSSLINGLLCAQKNMVILGWHPVPHVFGADFSATGLCHLSLDPADLETKYEYWVTNNLAIQNKEAYQDFLMRFNYPFDGKATERVIQALIQP